MKHGLLFALTPMFFAATAIADHGSQRLFAQLRPVNQVPSVETNATGEFRATIAADESSINFRVTFSNVSADLMQAHIHIGQFFANGGVSAFLCGGGGQPGCPTGASGTFSGLITSANVVGPADQGVAAADFAKLVRAIRRGVTYANLHNATFPAGEIRGQIVAL
ncbi:MAG: CHRD domain-containing protein [Steroidobacteraceae bacterium]